MVNDNVQFAAIVLREILDRAGPGILGDRTGYAPNLRRWMSENLSQLTPEDRDRLRSAAAMPRLHRGSRPLQQEGDGDRHFLRSSWH